MAGFDLSNLTWGTLLLIAGIASVILAQTVAKNVGTRKTWTWIGSIGVIIGLLPLIGIQGLTFLQNPVSFGGTSTASVGITQTGQQVLTTGLCAVEDTTVTLSAQDKYTSVATGGSHRYRIDGAPAQTVADQGTFTASPGDRLEILFFNASNTGASNYFGEKLTVTVPCKGTETYSAKLVTNGTTVPTINIFNEEGNVIDGLGTNETLGAGDLVSLTWEVKGVFQTGYPHGLVLTSEYDPTIYDTVKYFIGGTELTPASIPVGYSRRYLGANRTVAFNFPKMESNEVLKGTITVDVATSPNPAATELHKIVVNLRPNNYFINEDNGGNYEGPSAEDEDNGPTFRSVFNATIAPS